ncbi:hypothetical protein BOX15_Mlig023649g1 [Macrostomum lignano]|uniref:PDZ domain-containing protein n=1 Tax=Macrostomum lignano TaxID=282301 RepID=A0A267FBN6_9PLAT|nr:hypothetical protein BOX15_Mlig023649g1 [Macrostomum lignano]
MASTNRMYAPSSSLVKMSPTAAAAAVAARRPLRADHQLGRLAASTLTSCSTTSPAVSAASVAASAFSNSQLNRPVRAVGIVTNPRIRRRLGKTAVVASSPHSTTGSQTSPTSSPPPEQQQPQPHLRRVWRTPTKWACRKFVRIFRSLSASSFSNAAATSDQRNLANADDLPTPKDCRLRHCRHRQASLQRLGQLPVQAAAPPDASGLSSCGGRVLHHHPDGSRTVLLCRPPNGRFGFFLAKKTGGTVYVSRFADSGLESWYSGLLSVGDTVESIAGLRPDSVSFEAVGARIGGRTVVQVKVK